MSDHEVDGQKIHMDYLKTLIDGSKTLDEQEMRQELAKLDIDLKKSTLAAKNSASGSETRSPTN